MIARTVTVNLRVEMSPATREFVERCFVCSNPYERAYVCESDRGSIPRTLDAIVDLWSWLPDAVIPRAGTGERVSGTTEPRLPIALDPIDLAAPAWTSDLTPAGLEHPDDQIGHTPAATILDSWVRLWRDERGLHERLPEANVRRLAKWLAARYDWACSNSPTIGDFVKATRKLESTLRGVTQVDRDDTQHIGHCPGSKDQRCGTELRVTPWQESAQCPRCERRWPRNTWLSLRSRAAT